MARISLTRFCADRKRIGVPPPITFELQNVHRYGHPRLLRIPARVLYRRPELDVHYAMSDLDIGVRRSGMDVDPGWIDWLGTIVRFHYR